MTKIKPNDIILYLPSSLGLLRTGLPILLSSLQLSVDNGIISSRLKRSLAKSMKQETLYSNLLTVNVRKITWAFHQPFIAFYTRQRRFHFASSWRFRFDSAVYWLLWFRTERKTMINTNNSLGTWGHLNPWMKHLQSSSSNNELHLKTKDCSLN